MNELIMVAPVFCLRIMRGLILLISSFYETLIIIYQVLLVTGGFGIYDPRSIRSSTEVYYPSAGEWTQVGDLPRAMAGLSAVTLNNKILVFGEMIILALCFSIIECLF